MKRLVLLLLLLSSLSLSASATSSTFAATRDITDMGRELLASHATSVVTVGGILSVDLGMMGQQEPEFEIIGTVVDASGLTIVSNSDLNAFGDQTHEFEPQPGMSMQVSAKIQQVWLQLEDGTRLDAKVVMKDVDLDLAFIRPIDPEAAVKASFTPIVLDHAASGASVLDEVVTLTRLSRHGGWMPSIQLQRVRAVIEQPRTCYEVGSELGSAVLNASGQVLGITVNLKDAGQEFDVQRFLMQGPEGMGLPVVLPVSEFASLIDQARDY